MAVTLSNNAVAQRVGTITEQLDELVAALDLDDTGDVKHLVTGARRLLAEASTRLASGLEQFDQI